MNSVYNSSSVDLGGVFQLVKSVGNSTLSSERVSLTSVSNSNAWLSLLSIEYNVETMHCNLWVDRTDMFMKVNDKLTLQTYKSSTAMYDLLFNVYTKVATDALLSTIYNNISLKAIHLTSYTKFETYGKLKLIQEMQ